VSSTVKPDSSTNHLLPAFWIDRLSKLAEYGTMSYSNEKAKTAAAGNSSGPLNRAMW